MSDRKFYWSSDIQYAVKLIKPNPNMPVEELEERVSGLIDALNQTKQVVTKPYLEQIRQEEEAKRRIREEKANKKQQELIARSNRESEKYQRFFDWELLKSAAVHQFETSGALDIFKDLEGSLKDAKQHDATTRVIQPTLREFGFGYDPKLVLSWGHKRRYIIPENLSFEPGFFWEFNSVQIAAKQKFVPDRSYQIGLHFTGYFELGGEFNEIPSDPEELVKAIAMRAKPDKSLNLVRPKNYSPPLKTWFQTIIKP